MAAVVVSVRLPSVVKAARLMAVEPLFKVMCAWFKTVVWVMNVIAPVRALEALLRVIDLSSAFVVKLDVPDTVRAPVWVMASSAVTDSVPETTDAPSTKALASFKITLLPLVMMTAPVKSLVAVSRVMSLADPAASVVVPDTVRAPVCVMAPPDVAERVPVTV